jgi:hypothetical protein
LNSHSLSARVRTMTRICEFQKFLWLFRSLLDGNNKTVRLCKLFIQIHGFKSIWTEIWDILMMVFLWPWEVCWRYNKKTVRGYASFRSWYAWLWEVCWRQ